VSFLYDPPALVATGYAIGGAAPSRQAERVAELATLAVFIGTSVALYRNRPWTQPLVTLFGARSGRDWMLNSGITNFDETGATARTHWIAAAIFAAYPLFLRWGLVRGRRHNRSTRPREDLR
jgi:hypothetical protein